MDCQITGRLNGRTATREDYESLFADCERPHKFSAYEVGYTPVAAHDQRCAECMHYFVNPLRIKTRLVCEIMRPPGEAPVSPMGTCRFWNQGKGFPLLNF